MASMRVAALPEARFALGAMHFSLDMINGMIARHVNGGGLVQTTSEVACEFVQTQQLLVETWAPDCMVRQPSPEDVRVNDTVFSETEGRCVPLVCPPAQILTYSSVFAAFACEDCRSGEIPDSVQRSCEL
eukprot:5185107-Amphidinium_carterae.2